MEIVIDTDAAEPVFAQLVAQIKAAVQNKVIAPGDPLPSIRQLAGDLALNNKTVAKAYRLLERDNVIEAKGYRGSFIHPQAQQNCTVDLSDWTAEKLATTVKTLREAGVTDSEIRIAFSEAMLNANS